MADSVNDCNVVTKDLRYQVFVEMAWKATCISPISGEPLTAYGVDIDDARRRLDMRILAECEDRGLSVQRLKV
jgi:hypothetical protein